MTRKNSTVTSLKPKSPLKPLKEKMVSELAGQYEIYPTMINGWKKKILEQASRLFEIENPRKKIKEKAESQIDELYRQIGKLKVERDLIF